MARERLILVGSQIGSRVRKLTGDVEVREVGAGHSYCLDFTGRDSDHPLTIEHFRINHPTITGDTGGIPDGYVWSSYPVTNLGANMTAALPPVTPEPDDTWAATKVAAETNPGRPEVSVPLLLFESFSSLPESILSLGTSLTKKKRKNPTGVGNSVAANNFGWQQLYRDVAALFDFTEHVEKRVKELNQLYSKGGLKRKRTVWVDSSVEHFDGVPLQSQGTWVDADVQKTVYRKKWVTTRWRPASEIPFSPADQVQRARELVHGWHLAPADVWNALPWSWLADYFGNIGDFLGATRNSSEFHLESCCVMTYFKMTCSYRAIYIKPGHDLTVTREPSSWETKSRTVGGVGLTTNVPIISAQRLTNLLGIAANYR